MLKSAPDFDYTFSKVRASSSSTYSMLLRLFLLQLSDLFNQCVDSSLSGLSITRIGSGSHLDRPNCPRYERQPTVACSTLQAFVSSIFALFCCCRGPTCMDIGGEQQDI